PRISLSDGDNDGYLQSNRFSEIGLYTDCADSNTWVYLGATEICSNGIDEDCDELGSYDPDGLASDEVDCTPPEDAECPQWRDLDGDGFGDAAFLLMPQDPSCRVRSGFAPNATDCDDGRDDVNADAVEACDGFDSDCDGVVDDGCPDGDGDGVPDALDIDSDGDGVEDLLDCAPRDPRISPLAWDVPCDGLDADCDGDPFEGYPDLDADGYASPHCPDAAVPDDCSDTDPETWPARPGGDVVGSQAWDGVDNDCDGMADEGRYLCGAALPGAAGLPSELVPSGLAFTEVHLV
ncbi:putative metal-binding motif-containing protein, partial [Myxococcota bacterium]|nr:putative metal-binding motif-containing protein [Myxococcota bacterium]